MKLYYTPKTSAFRCRWMLEELGAAYDLVPINLLTGEHKKPDYLRVNPLGTVPTLVDGDRTIIESAAIVLHLADQDPQQRLAPALGDRAAYYQWVLYAMTDLYGVVHPAYLRFFFHNQAASDSEQATFAHRVSITDAALQAHPFLLGSQFTAADVIVGGVLLWAADAGLLAGREPQADYLARLQARPAFQRAAAE